MGVVMKLKSTFLVNKISGETVAVPLEGSFHGVVRANASAGFILECLKNETSFEEVLEKLLAEYDVSREKAAADLEKIIAGLKELDALED